MLGNQMTLAIRAHLRTAELRASPRQLGDRNPPCQFPLLLRSVHGVGHDQMALTSVCIGCTASGALLCLLIHLLAVESFQLLRRLSRQAIGGGFVGI